MPPYSLHEWDFKKRFSSSAFGWASPQSLSSTYWWASMSCVARATASSLIR